MTESALRFDGVSFAYGTTRALDDVTLVVPAGETTALLGPSGSGKSTLLRLALGLDAPASGTVHVGTELVSAGGRVVVPPEARRLAVVFQDLALYPHLSVARNLEFGLAAQGVVRADRKERIATMLERVGLTEKRDQLPRDLSGGERQRVAIARALVQEPRAVLLDEPVTSLDVERRRAVLELFRSILEESGVTALWVTHDLREALAIADRAVVLEAGRISQQGSMEELTASPATDFVRALVDDRRWSGERG